jgi:uncharacterized protein (DUF4415 family)
MVIKTTLEERGPITQEEIEMLERASKMPIVFDEDSPELTEEDLKGFRRVSEENRLERNKQTVTLRLSPQALRKARSLGKGYTSVLSRILEGALSDNDVIRHYL